MLRQYTLKMPGQVHAGTGALEQLAPLAAAAGTRRAAVFAGRHILDGGLLEPALAALREAGVEPVILTDVPAEPTYAQAQAQAEAFRDTGAGCIVAVGGGSVMDTAKLCSVLGTGEYTVRDLLENPALGKKCCPTVMVPTTAGTGAEATPNAIVAVPEQELKVGIVNSAMIPDAVILDGSLLRDIPRSLAAATGVDALCHAIECFTSAKANPISDTFALAALEGILPNIRPACGTGAEAEAARSRMLLASFYAGVAITASGTTAVHALSYPLGGKYHIPHGVSNAMLLMPVMRFNAPCCRERFARAYDRCAPGAGTGLSQEEKSDQLLLWLGEIVRDLEIPTDLKAFGVPAEDLEGLVKAGMDVQRLLQNNPRPVAAEDAAAIYRQIL